MVTQYDYEKSIKEAEEEFKKRFDRLKKIAESGAILGKLENLEIRNATFYLKYSSDSKVDIATIIEGARSLGLKRGNIAFGGNIVKIGEHEVELEVVKGKVINLTDVSDNGMRLGLHSSVGELVITMYPDAQDKNLIKIEINDKEKFNQLSTKEKKEIGKNLQFGGLSFCEAIEQENFKRSGKLQSSEASSCFSQDVKEAVGGVMKTISSTDIKSTEEKSWINRVEGQKTNGSCSRGM